MQETFSIADKTIGGDHPTFIIAEIGINHNGDLSVAKKLIDIAAVAGCDAVKFQKRDPELCVPKDQRDKKRETPWGYITYIDYKHRIEFGQTEFDEIDAYCKRKNILWTASAWDEPSFDFVDNFGVSFHKIASATLTRENLLNKIANSNKPVILSTGMSTLDEIQKAIDILNPAPGLGILHCTSTYPCPVEELNLNAIHRFKERFKRPIGYSGHEVGLVPTWASVAMGAKIIERHITLDRSMWGTDQAASIEPGGLIRLVGGIRDIEKSFGDGHKRVYESEIPIREKLRG